jgi:hypothetical protein
MEQVFQITSQEGCRKYTLRARRIRKPIRFQPLWSRGCRFERINIFFCRAMKTSKLSVFFIKHAAFKLFVLKTLLMQLSEAN